MNDVKKLPRVIRQCMTIGMIPTSYKVSLTYEEQLMWFCKFLEDEVIPVVNNNSKVVEEIKHYFETLDVQEEINNKLDDMAEAGTLQEIIAAYLELQSLITFDTVADLKQATNLINGSSAQTLGHTTLNDGGKATYKIRTITNDDVVDEMFILSLADDTLVAELIVPEIINVHSLGIFGDNTDNTDDLETILEKENKYFFPSGTYNIASPITLEAHLLLGENDKTTLFKTIGENNHEMLTSNGIDNIEIKNIVFDFGTADDETKTAINFYNAENIKITDCEFKNGFGGHFRINNTKNVKIEECLFHDISGDTGNMGNCIYLHPAKNVTITKCECYNVREDFVYLDGESDNSVSNVTIINNLIKGCGYQNEQASANAIGINGNCTHIIIKDNIFENNKNGIKTAERYSVVPSNIVIENNYIYNCGQNGMTINSDNNFINNNNISYCGQDGINVNNSENTKLSNNLIHHNTRDGLIAHTLSHLYLNDNNFYNNATGCTMGSSSRACNHVSINNCNAYNNSSFGFQVLTGSDIKISSCLSYSNLYNWDVSSISTNNIMQLIPEYGKSDIRSITYTDAEPTAGVHRAGDIAINSAPAVGEPFAWICTVAGTPGTWNALAEIE